MNMKQNASKLSLSITEIKSVKSAIKTLNAILNDYSSRNNQNFAS